MRRRIVEIVGLFERVMRDIIEILFDHNMRKRGRHANFETTPGNGRRPILSQLPSRGNIELHVVFQVPRIPLHGLKGPCHHAEQFYFLRDQITSAER